MRLKSGSASTRTSSNSSTSTNRGSWKPSARASGSRSNSRPWHITSRPPPSTTPTARYGVRTGRLTCRSRPTAASRSTREVTAVAPVVVAAVQGPVVRCAAHGRRRGRPVKTSARLGTAGAIDTPAALAVVQGPLVGCAAHERRRGRPVKTGARLGTAGAIYTPIRRVRVVIRAYAQVLPCACAACCGSATMSLVSWMKLSRFADEKLFGCCG